MFIYLLDIILQYTERASAQLKKNDTEIYKYYCTVIKTSINLQNIEDKVESGVYKTPGDIELDWDGV